MTLVQQTVNNVQIRDDVIVTRSSAIAATARVSVTSSVDGLTKYSPIYYIWGNRNRNLERDLLLVLIFISLTELSTHEILYTNMLYLLTR